MQAALGRGFVKAVIEKFLQTIVLVMLALIGISWVGIRAIRIYYGKKAKACQENLVKIDEAVERWALDHVIDVEGNPTLDALVQSGALKESLVCPSGGSYIISGEFQEPVCTSGISDHQFIICGGMTSSARSSD